MVQGNVPSGEIATLKCICDIGDSKGTQGKEKRRATE